MKRKENYPEKPNHQEGPNEERTRLKIEKDYNEILGWPEPPVDEDATDEFFVIDPGNKKNRS